MAIALLDFTTPHVLRNAREYKAAVSEIDRLVDAGADDRTREDEERLEFLALLVEAYEEQHYPRDESGTPQGAVAFMLEQKGLTRTDLLPLMGGKARVSEFFSGKRRLSMEQVRALRDHLGVPADLLIA
jgi:HTH-type transcriptional regulator/antitoxin HigA